MLFIKGRRQRVVVNGNKSTWLDLKSSVPHGSVIGPLLFLIFINIMPNEMNCNIQLFADDATIFKTVDNEEDHQDLAKDFDNLDNWARLWQMRFNVGKCKVLHLGSRNTRYEYNMGDLILEAATEEKELGVIIDEKLKVDKHTEAQVNKANKVLGLIRRSFETLGKENLVWLFKALVRQHLEYCNTVTYPVYEKLLESVQRRATKMVPEMKNCDYATRLNTLALPSLSYRRKRGDMIEVYKHTHGLYKVSALPVEVEEKTTRGHNYKLKKNRCSTTRRLTFFSMRVVKACNSFPVHVVNAVSVNAFKSRLDMCWAHVMFRPELPAREQL